MHGLRYYDGVQLIPLDNPYAFWHPGAFAIRMPVRAVSSACEVPFTEIKGVWLQSVPFWWGAGASRRAMVS